MNESKNLIQRFFDASLIPADTGDERLGHYQKTAVDLAKRFTENPRDAISASRVAIDPKCPASDPWFEIVQDAVKVHWKTFLANHHDAPRLICRAILLEALSEAVAEDEDLTAAIWYATSSLLSHLGNGPEQAITRDFISKLGDKCETYSSSLWQLNENAKIKSPDYDISLSPIKITKVDEAALTKGMARAAGPQGEDGSTTGHNQYWSNNTSSWAFQFAPISAKAIATEVNKAIAAVAPALNELPEQLEPALKKHGASLVKLIRNSTELNQRLTGLLWWKQALYSPTLRRSYREFSPVDIAVAMPFDLSSISSAPVSLSVEFFLRETVRAVVPADPKLTLDELIEAIKVSGQIVSCLPISPSGPPHRASLREFLSLTRQGTHSAEIIPAHVGIKSTTALKLSDWSVWVLRERLAEMLTMPKK